MTRTTVAEIEALLREEWMRPGGTLREAFERASVRLVALFPESDGEFNADLRSLATTPEAKAFAEKLISAGGQRLSDRAGEAVEPLIDRIRQHLESHIGHSCTPPESWAIVQALGEAFNAGSNGSSAALTAARSENERMRDRVCNLEFASDASSLIIDDMRDEKERLRTERDEFAKALTQVNEGTDHMSYHDPVIAKARRIVEGK